jgi:hypothetical protein
MSVVLGALFWMPFVSLAGAACACRARRLSTPGTRARRLSCVGLALAVPGIVWTALFVLVFTVSGLY